MPVYVLLSVAASVDGHIGDAGPTRLVLSNDADLDRVDEVRAGCDAILVGAGTVRADDPRLLVRSEQRRAARVAAGRPAHPAKVTLTASGDLDPGARFFTTGDGAKLVYTTRAGAAAARRLRGHADVVELGDRLDAGAVVADLAARGVERLLVEGGSQVQAAFLAADLVDELHVAVAPLLVGDPAAPRFTGRTGRTLQLAETRRLGEVVVLRYLLAR